MIALVIYYLLIVIDAFSSCAAAAAAAAVVVVVVGAGKSSLLAALLGELRASGMQTELLVGDEVFPVRDSLQSGREYVKWKNRRQTRVAFCSQQPWIVAASVKANIVLAGRASSSTPSEKGRLAGKQRIEGFSEVENDEEDEEEEDFKHPAFVDTKLYEETLSLCKLREDCSLWPERDQTEIGERGVSVSGV